MHITTDRYSITFDAYGSITALQSNGKEFVGKVLPLFRLRLRDGGQTTHLSATEANHVQICAEGAQLYFEYDYNEPNITVNVTVTCAQRITFGLSYCNHTGKCVEWIDFPQLAVPNDLVRAGGSGRALIDINEGLLVEDMAFKEAFGPYRHREPEYPSEGLYAMFPAAVQSPFLAYYDDTCGVYLAAEDEQRSIKGVDLAPCGTEAIQLAFRLYPGVTADTVDYTLPFPMVLDFFIGDWHDAAELYRSWFEQHLPEGLKKIAENDALPEWYTDSPLIVTYPVQGIHDMDEAKPNRLFPYHNALPYLDDIAEKTNSRVMSLLMHWEGTAPWAPPYVWPPLGGADMLQNYCEALHRRNYLLGVYCSGISYTIRSNINDYSNEETIERENLTRYMCAPPDGGQPVSKICQAQRSSYDMCISQEFTKQTLCDEAAKMASVGLDYIQILDQNHGGTPYFCYSDAHGHPPVPGGWLVDHMNDFLKRLKQTVGDRVLLGCESAAAEAYVPYLNLSDNRFNLNYAAGRPIALYGYIYHEYLQNFSGNSVCSLLFVDIHKSPDCHMLRVAHSYLAGDLMTLVINQDGEIVWSWGERDFSVLPPRAPIMAFVRSATTYRRGVGKDYLVYGKMVKPCTVACETVPMYKPDNDYRTDYPAVLTSAWQAPDGTKAQFLATYRCQIEMCKVDLRGTNGAIVLDENGAELQRLPAEMCELMLLPHSVRMLKFCE